MDYRRGGCPGNLLIVVAQRLLSAVRDGDLVARCGGDEFAILARHVSGPESATNVALRVIHALEAPVATGVLRHQISVGIGIALAPSDGTAEEEVLRKADVALYRAKAERRSALRFFEEHMDNGVRFRQPLPGPVPCAAQESAAIVSALVGLGSGLGLTVAAEGIDASQQSASLLGSGCTVGQGHLFGAPVSAELTARFFESREESESPRARQALR